MTTNNDFCDENEKKTNDYVKKSHNEQDLTEQWKKGELKTGWYYVKNEFGHIFISEYSKGYDHINERIEKDFFTEDSDITEIICKVPSYTEWKQMKEQRDACAWALDKIGDVLVKHKLVKK